MHSTSCWPSRVYIGFQANAEIPKAAMSTVWQLFCLSRPGGGRRAAGKEQQGLAGCSPFKRLMNEDLPIIGCMSWHLKFHDPAIGELLPREEDSALYLQGGQRPSAGHEASKLQAFPHDLAREPCCIRSNSLSIYDSTMDDGTFGVCVLAVTCSFRSVVCFAVVLRPIHSPQL